MNWKASATEVTKSSSRIVVMGCGACGSVLKLYRPRATIVAAVAKTSNRRTEKHEEARSYCFRGCNGTFRAVFRAKLLRRRRRRPGQGQRRGRIRTQVRV